MILYITININFSSFPHSLFFYLPLVATIILDFSLRLTHTFCYSSPLPTDFLSFSLYFLFFSLFLHLYSFLRIPVPSFRRAIHTSILPLHAMPSLSLSPFRWRSSTSLLFRLRFVLFALFLTPSSRSCATLPLRSSFSSTLCSSFSVSFSHTSHSSSHIPSRSCFRSRFRALLSSPRVVPLYPWSLALSLSLFYAARSGGALPSPLAPLNYDRLTLFISRGVPISFSSSSSAPSASSVSLLLFVSLSRLILQVSPHADAVPFVLSLSLCSPFSFFFLTCVWWSQELFILYRKVVRNPQNPLWISLYDINFEILFGHPFRRNAQNSRVLLFFIFPRFI